MCFGNKLNQNRPEHCITPFPTHNNFCGGFALNAVLVDLGSGTCPIEVYMRIQDYQNKEIIKPYPNSSASIYLLGNKSSGTLMSDRKSTRLNSSHRSQSRMPSSA